MIAIYSFAAAWVLLGVGILIFALTKGRKAPEGPVTPARRNWYIVSFGFLYAVVGLGLPALSIADSHNSGVVRAEGIKLTANQQKGRNLFGDLCAGCHRLASANAQGRVGPNLDIQYASVPAADPAAARKAYNNRVDSIYDTILNGIDRGNGNMPALVAQGEQARNIAEFVAATAGHANP